MNFKKALNNKVADAAQNGEIICFFTLEDGSVFKVFKEGDKYHASFKYSGDRFKPEESIQENAFDAAMDVLPIDSTPAFYLSRLLEAVKTGKY